MQIFTLASDRLEARILDYGATLMSLKAPDRHGALGELLLGFEDPERYRGPHPYFGGIIGRYANRIAHAQFLLDGKTYPLARNNGRHHLHGGVVGFDRVQWKAAQRGNAVELRYISRDGEQGYPGTLEVRVVYTVERNALKIEYCATTDAPTILNLTNHAYFNLAGAGTIDEHVVRIEAGRYVEVDKERIPTGVLRPVAGTPMDLNVARPLDGLELDHSFVLEGMVEVHAPASGRRLRITTTQPAVQLYTGNLLDGSIAGRGGVRYERRAGLCLEPQHFPDSPNQPAFPSTVLRPGERYAHSTSYEVTPS